MNKNKELNIIIIKLISTFLNKLYLNRLEFKELTTTLLKISK